MEDVYRMVNHRHVEKLVCHKGGNGPALRAGLHHLAMSSSRKSGTAIGSVAVESCGDVPLRIAGHFHGHSVGEHANGYTGLQRAPTVQRFDIGIASF